MKPLSSEEIAQVVKSVKSDHHWCAEKCMGALIYWKRQRQFGAGYVLRLEETFTKGRLKPERIGIEYPIEFCPFCGLKLEKVPISK